MNRLLSAHLALLGANAIYSLNYTIAKDVMPEYIMPFGFIFCRVTGALLLFWFFHSLFYRERVARSDLKRLMLCGLFGVATNQLLFFKGLSISHPISASVIMTTNPILVLIMSAAIAGERITRLKTIGVIIGLTGALILIFFKSGIQFGPGKWTGDLMIFINATSYGLYLVLVKPLMRKYKPITVIKWVFLFGYIPVFPIGFLEFAEISWSSMPPEIIWKTAYVIIGTTFLAYLLNIFALKIITPTVSSSYIYLQPVLASLFAIWMGKDQLTLIKISAAALIFFGVYMVSTPEKKKV